MEVVILIGLQGSGKSTFYRAHFAATHVHISKDNFRNAHNRARRQQQLLEQALQAGRSAVIDNTNPTREDRTSILQAAQAAGAVTVGYYFEPDLQGCLERNRQREGKARVPDIALFATARKLEPPTFAEGFDRLFLVRTLLVRTPQDQQFQIEPWSETLTPERTNSL